MTPPRFDSLAPLYRRLEAATFGGRLQACRTAMLDRMTTARRALVIGDGDGRFLRELLRANPGVTVEAVDGSAAMTAAAERRAGTIPGGRERVRFTVADARTVRLEPAAHELIVTHFFLDCFPKEQLGPLVRRIAAACAPGGLWVIGDFRLPPRGAARVLGGLALLGMYAFFRLATGLPTRWLIDPDPFLLDYGFRPAGEATWLGGFLSCKAWRRPK